MRVRAGTTSATVLLAGSMVAAGVCRGACDITELLAAEGAGGDHFGVSAAADGVWAVIGAHRDDGAGTNAGAAYVFAFDGAVWSLSQRLEAPDAAEGALFGYTVAVSGDVIVVGAFADSANGVTAGAAYVFRHDGTEWNPQQKLLPDGGDANDKFGISVAASGDAVLVGSNQDGDNGTFSGSAYVFRYDGSTWNQEQKLLPDDGAAHDQFGISVALDGDVAVIGAYFDDDPGPSAGSAYVFRHDGSVWAQQQKLLASDGSAGDHFGVAVAVDAGVAVVGASIDDDNGDGSGSAYVFASDDARWSQQQKLLAGDGEAGDRFGHAVAVAGGTAVIGAFVDDDNGDGSGSAYVFELNGSAWTQQRKLLDPNGAALDHFGVSVAIGGDGIVVGADQDDDSGPDAGAAHVFETACCPADCGGAEDGSVGIADFLALLGRWGSAGSCDIDADGTIGIADFLTLLGSWGACP